MQLAPHCPLGPIALAACLQVGFSTPNFLIQEQSIGIHYNRGAEVLDYVLDKTPLAFVDGCIERLTAPGLGIEVDEHAVRDADEKATHGVHRYGGTPTGRSRNGDHRRKRDMMTTQSLMTSADFLRRPEHRRCSRSSGIAGGCRHRGGVCADRGGILGSWRSPSTPMDALRVIQNRLASEWRSRRMVGAGTVLSASDVAHARAAGSTFLVTPAVAPSVAESVRQGIPVIAGAMTPPRRTPPCRPGAAAVKLFPASQRRARVSCRRCAIHCPPRRSSPSAEWTCRPLRQYWAAGAVAVGIGGPLVKDAASGGDLDALRERARAFLGAAAENAPPRWTVHAQRPDPDKLDHCTSARDRRSAGRPAGGHPLSTRWIRRGVGGTIPRHDTVFPHADMRSS